MRVLILLFFAINLFANCKLELVGELKSGSMIIGHCKGATKVTLNSRELKLNSGAFVFGFDRDDVGEFKLKIDTKSGTFEKILDVKPREYDIQVINNLDDKKVNPDKTSMERIKQERDLILAKKDSLNSSNQIFKFDISSPIKSGRISGVFGSQRVLNGVKKAPHNGVDIASPIGTPIYSFSSGKVILVGDLYFGGKTILVDNGSLVMSIYMHLNSIDVKEGDIVKAGEKIGEVGKSGRATGAHLHFGLEWNKKRIDPMSLINFNL